MALNLGVVAWTRRADIGYPSQPDRLAADHARFGLMDKRELMKLSVIIANHNYRDFVGAAISSALAVDWPDKEVIVVDDASTDGSRGVIDGFRGQVAAYFRPKSYQLGAHI